MQSALKPPVTSDAADDNQAQKMLLGTVYSAEIWDQVLAVSESWGRLRLAHHCDEEANTDLLRWVPEVVAIATQDAWHPEDTLLAPLTTENGS